MKIGLIIYGSLETVSGGYLYDRKLVEYLRGQGDTVEIISLPWRNYASHLTDNLHFRLPTPSVIATFGKQSPNNQPFDVLIQDELNHPSLIWANRGKHPYPIVSLVHHLRCSELRPKWQNDLYRIFERKYLQSVDGFIFNSKTTQGVVHGMIGDGKPSIVAYPPTDRFSDKVISEEEILKAGKNRRIANFVFRKCDLSKGIAYTAQCSQKSKVEGQGGGGRRFERRAEICRGNAKVCHGQWSIVYGHFPRHTRQGTARRKVQECAHPRRTVKL